MNTTKKTAGAALLGMVGNRRLSGVPELVRHALGALPPETNAPTAGEPNTPTDYRGDLEKKLVAAEAKLDAELGQTEWKAARKQMQTIEQQIAAFDAGVASAAK